MPQLRTAYTYALLIVATLSLTACKRTFEKPPQNKDVLHLPLACDLSTFDPRILRSTQDLTVAKHLYEGLMRLGASGRPTCALAESWTLSSDGCTYTFHLRNARWEDGTPLTAHDFVRSWQEVLSPAFACPNANLFYSIKNAREAKANQCSPNDIAIEAPDEKTLIVTLEKPTSYFLELTACPTYFPISKNKNAFLSSGPFCIESWERDNSLTLKKNEHYWDKQNVALSSIVFMVLPDQNTAFYLYEKGELDWLGPPLSASFSSELIEILKKDSCLRAYPVAGTFWIQFNIDDIKLRQALSNAIDRKDIIDNILQGEQQIATRLIPPAISSYTSPNNRLGEPKLERYHNLPKLTLTFPNFLRTAKIAEVIASVWKEKLGIEVTLVRLEYQCYKEALRKGDFTIATGEWVADYNDPLAFLELFQSKDSCCNHTHWENDVYNQLLNSASLMPQSKERESLFRQAEDIFLKECIVSPLYHYSFDYLIKDTVRDITVSPLGLVDFKRAKK